MKEETKPSPDRRPFSVFDISSTSSDEDFTERRPPKPAVLARSRAIKVTNTMGEFVRNHVSISAAARWMMDRWSGNFDQNRAQITKAVKRGTVWKEYYFTPIVNEQQKTVSDTNWEAGISPGDFAVVIEGSSSSAPATTGRVRTQTRPFIESEHCELNRPPKKKVRKDMNLKYTEGVEESLFCFGHPRVQSTVVYPIGCACSIKLPHCLQCMTTGRDTHGNQRCYNCNTALTGLSFILQ